jgi:hypothetical protein
VSRFTVQVSLGWGARVLFERVFWQCRGVVLPVLDMLCVLSELLSEGIF